MHDVSNLPLAFGLTILAGLATGLGSALAFFAKRTDTKLLSVMLGFSAGVMLYVSFIEIFFKAKRSLGEILGPVPGAWGTAAAFFGGIILIAVIDKLVPSYENPHEPHKIEEMHDARLAAQYSGLYRMGLMAAAAIGIHNFPEGLATFLAALQDPNLGTAIALAIAIHNIPEGIAVSIPIYYATGSRKKAFLYSFLSGLAEPVGALLGYLVLYSFFSEILFGLAFAGVAGIMVFISLDELLPAADKFGEHHLAIYGLIGGMVMMALSLLLLL